MRLIDADALNSVEKEIVCGKTRSPYMKDYTAILRIFEVDEIRNAPTVDAVPIVRCKNCVHRHWTQEPEHGRTVHYCDIFEEQIDDNFFCGKGSET